MATVIRQRALGAINTSCPQVAVCLGPIYVSRRGESSAVVKGQTGNLAAYKRGRGGRSSFSGIVATVFGATGFTGRYIVNRLGKIGCQVIIPYRTDPYHTKDLKLAGDLGQILFLPYHLKDEESIKKAMKYSNVVINLVGREWETKNFNFNDVNVEGARRIARLAREAGVEKLVHFSHLNAQPDPPAVVYGRSSLHLKSKYFGELAVREEFPDATIFRPADIYGHEDRFLRYYASRWRTTLGRMELWKGGKKTIKSPVFVSDVAEGVINALYDPEAPGQIYQCIGPHKYYLRDLVNYVYDCMRYGGIGVIPFFTAAFLTKTWLFQQAPSTPILTLDKLAREHVSDIVDIDHPTLEDLSVELSKLEDLAPYFLKPYRKNRAYEDKLGEIPDPVPPPIIPNF